MHSISDLVRFLASISRACWNLSHRFSHFDTFIFDTFIFVTLIFDTFIFDTSDTKNTPLTQLEGCPIQDKLNSQTVGPRGPMLLQDVAYLEEMAHFDRERIPERVVHAKGGGAFGVFEVTSSAIQKYCKAAVFSK